MSKVAGCVKQRTGTPNRLKMVCLRSAGHTLQNAQNEEMRCRGQSYEPAAARLANALIRLNIGPMEFSGLPRRRATCS